MRPGMPAIVPILTRKIMPAAPASRDDGQALRAQRFAIGQKQRKSVEPLAKFRNRPELSGFPVNF